jgi:uncharacterized membrane protein YidH (DUF202 family)
MSLQEARMGDLPKLKGRDANPRRPMIWIALAAMATIFIAGMLHGVIDASIEKKKILSASNIIAIAVLIGTIAALIYAQWHWIKAIRNGSEPLTPRETLNRNFLMLFAVIGAFTGAGMIILLDPSKNMSLLEILISYDKPIPISFSIFFVISWSIVTPIITWLWYSRAIDEQESNAYRDGGNYAAHAYMFIVPAWWMLWRAGLVTEPNGIIIFFVFIIIWSIIWLWKKYF